MAKTMDEFRRSEEALCTKCGKCCENSMPVATEDGVELKDCKHLKNDKTCSIYNERDKKKPYWCSTIQDAKDFNTLGFLPDGCPYKEDNGKEKA